jgi:tRNA dimethylallyltransferase
MAEQGGAAAPPHAGAPDVLAITGATATGKTDVALRTAQLLGGEIISMDSRQVYRGMEIGTARPPVEERRGVPHHGFDLVTPDVRFNAGRFADLAIGWMEEIRCRGAIPILAGGTGFFLRALTHPMFEEPPLDPALKEAWKRYLGDVPTDRLEAWARAVDPDTPVRPGDRQRLARVVELAMLTGRPLSWWHRHAVPARPPLQPLVVVLDMPREFLYRRIEERVDRMLEDGLVAEVESLIAAGYDERDPGLNATGYIEVIPFLRGEYHLGEAALRIKAATRRYARRQVTWLRHQLPPGAVWLDARRDAAVLADEIAGTWREAQG